LIGARDYRLWIEIINGSDKTFIERIEKGFDFLGYYFSPEGLSMGEKTIEKFLVRAVRLYEQEWEEPCGSPLLGLYVRRWMMWVRGITSHINTSRLSRVVRM
jgi:hypothetical protein